jgi:hypothetical protein
MEKHCGKTFRNFARYVYCQFGMRIAVLAAYRDSEGEAAISLYVPSFSTYESNRCQIVLTPMTILEHNHSKVDTKTGLAIPWFGISLSGRQNAWVTFITLQWECADDLDRPARRLW